MMEKVKKVTGYRLFLPLSSLLIVLLINLVTTPTFFKISITNGVLYGYIIDVINRASELVVLAVGMTLPRRERIFPCALSWRWRLPYVPMCWPEERSRSMNTPIHTYWPCWPVWPWLSCAAALTAFW